MVHDAVSDLTEPTTVWGVTRIMVTQVLKRQDPRTKESQMEGEKRAEGQSLMKRGIFKVIYTKDEPPDGNGLAGMFLISMKTDLDGRAKEKS